MPRCESGSRRARISRPRGYAEGRVPAWTGRWFRASAGEGRIQQVVGAGVMTKKRFTVSQTANREPSAVTRTPRACGRLFLVGDDPHLDLRDHLAVDLHGHGALAQGLERLGQLDFPLVDVEALFLQRLGDVRRGDRPVEGVVLADAARELDPDGAETGRHRLGRGPLFHVARFGQLLLALDLAPVVLGHGPRPLAVQEVVARVPRPDPT